VQISQFDLKTLRRAYDRLNREGKMRVSFAQLLNKVEENRTELQETADEFYRAMIEGRMLPNSPTLMNAGRELQQLSACFVLPVEDSMVSIFESVKNAALIHKSGGGTGFSFSRLRPRNDVVRSTGGVASGPVSFLKVFNAATEAVKQGGTRRGANMGILRVDHPDILQYITCKADDREITNFNLSVALTDSFMEAVQRDEEYELINPRSGEVVRSLPARQVFDLIVDMAWHNGEPGIIFIDRMNEHNPTPQVGDIESTNPCGEQPLLPYESCNLASINLGRFVQPRAGSPDERVDWDGLRETIHIAIHMLDNVIEANNYPVVEIEECTKANRKVGLGVMGWADMLIKLGIPYDSEEGVELARRVMQFIDRESKDKSSRLAHSRGAFPNFPGSAYDRDGSSFLRNATTTTIAPTGTISIIAGASSGIEPLFSLAFTRHVLDGEELVEVNPLFEEAASGGGFLDPGLVEEIAERGSVRGLPGIPAEVQEVFVTALDIEPEWHVRMQAAFQEFTDNAVSKTINFPHSSTREDIAGAYLMAYQLGCKGLTVYRDGSRQEQVLTVGSSKEPGSARDAAREGQGAADRVEVDGSWGSIRPLKRAPMLRGVTARRTTPMGNLYLTLNLHKGHPFELFALIGKAGSDVTAFTEAIARLVSLAFRCGVDPRHVTDELLAIGGSRSVGFGPSRIRSVPDAIGQFISEVLDRSDLSDENGDSPSDFEQIGLQTLSGFEQMAASENAPSAEKSKSVPASNRTRFGLCPSCGLHTLAYQEGCCRCLTCGYSEC